VPIKENAKNYLKILQNLPDQQKKIILWAVVAILGLILGSLWINTSLKRLEGLKFSLLETVSPTNK